MSKRFFLVLLIFSMFACGEQNQLERSLQTSWVVESVVLIETNEPIQLGMNLFWIKEDHTCELPALLFEKGSDANWKLSKTENGNYIFKIECEARPIFNGEYTVHFEQQAGLNKLILTSSTLRMVCFSQR